MSRMALETAIRLSAEVKGGANITKVQKSLQDLAKGSQITARDMDALRSATFQFARANDSTVAGIRGSVAAFRGLQEQAKIGSREFARYGSEIQRLEAKLRGLDGTAKATGSSLSLRGAAGSAAGSMVMGGGLQASLGAAAGSMAAAGPVGMAMAGGVMAGGALIAAGTTNALDEEASTRRIRTLSGEAEVLMERIRQLTIEQGYLSNSAEAGAAAYEILSSGFSKTSDVLAILKASTYGATGGFSDIKTVADAATSIMNSFSLGADKVTRVVDQMVQTQNDGKIVVDQYAQSVGRLAPTFAVAGLSVEEMNAAISALTAKGAPVETTMSGLNQTVKSIIKPTEEAKAVAAALGLEFSAAALQAKGLGGFLQDVIDKTKGNTAALGVLFSDIDGFKAVASLTNDGLKAYNKSLANMETLTGQSAKAARLAVDPVKQFTNAWKDFSATTGAVVLPALTGILQGMTAILDAARSTDWAKIGSFVQAQDGGPAAGSLTPGQARELARKNSRGSDWNNMAWPEGIPRPGTNTPLPRMRARQQPNDRAITALVENAGSDGGAASKPASKPARAESQDNSEALARTREGLLLDLMVARHQADYVQTQRQINDLILGQNAASEAGNALLALQIEGKRVLLESGLQQTKTQVEFNRMLEESASNQDKQNKALRDAVINAKWNTTLAEREESARFRLAEIDQKIAAQRKKDASDQLDLERERIALLAESMTYMQELSTRNSAGAGFQQGLEGYVDSVGNLRDAVGQLTTNTIGGLENSLTELATTGSLNFREFAMSVIADTQQMILRQFVLKTIMSLIGGLGGSATAKSFELPGAGFMPTNGFAWPSMEGGGYTGSGARSGGLDGRGGFMAMLHPQESVIDHTWIGPSLRRGGDGASYPAIPGAPAGGDGALADAAGDPAGGSTSYPAIPGGSSSDGASVQGQSGASTSSRFERTDVALTRLVEASKQDAATRVAMTVAASSGGPVRVQLETTRINSVDYVTLEQARGIANAAANRSTARQQRALQASPAARRSVGI